MEEVKEPKKKEQPAEVKKELQAIEVEHGTLAPKDSAELYRTVNIIAKGGGFPERFDNNEKRMAAYSLARSLMGDQWQLALNHIAPIRGSMTIYGELPRAIAERTKEVEEFKVYVIDNDYKEICVANKNLDQEPYAGVCQVRRKGRETKTFSYTVDEAKNAGQLPAKPDSPWNKYRKIMLMRKAQALGVKFEFPDAILGAEIMEHTYDEAYDLKDVTPSQSEQSVDKAAVLNQKFKIPPQAVAPSDTQQ